MILHTYSKHEIDLLYRLLYISITPKSEFYTILMRREYPFCLKLSTGSTYYRNTLQVLLRDKSVQFD